MTTDTKKKLEIEERRKKVAANILSGLNYRDLAGTLEVSVGTIASDVKAIVKQIRHDQVNDMTEVIALEVRRIDRALNAIWDKVTGGDLRAIETMIALQNQRSKYFGLYAPEATLDNPEDIEAVRQRRWEAITGNLKDVLEDQEAGDAQGQG